jgi:hypothetical protein
MNARRAVLERRDLALRIPLRMKLRFVAAGRRRVCRTAAEIRDERMRRDPTRAMVCRRDALEHESLRLTRAGEIFRVREDRLRLRLLQTYHAEEGFVMRTKIRNYGDWSCA